MKVEEFPFFESGTGLRFLFDEKESQGCKGKASLLVGAFYQKTTDTLFVEVCRPFDAAEIFGFDKKSLAPISRELFAVAEGDDAFQTYAKEMWPQDLYVIGEDITPVHINTVSDSIVLHSVLAFFGCEMAYIGEPIPGSTSNMYVRVSLRRQGDDSRIKGYRSTRVVITAMALIGYCESLTAEGRFPETLGCLILVLSNSEENEAFHSYLQYNDGLLYEEDRSLREKEVVSVNITSPNEFEAVTQLLSI